MIASRHAADAPLPLLFGPPALCGPEPLPFSGGQRLRLLARTRYALPALLLRKGDARGGPELADTAAQQARQDADVETAIGARLTASLCPHHMDQGARDEAQQCFEQGLADCAEVGFVWIQRHLRCSLGRRCWRWGTTRVPDRCSSVRSKTRRGASCSCGCDRCRHPPARR